MHLEERHTAENIATWLEEVIDKFNISPTKIKAVVHDNGANMVAAMRLLEPKHGWASVRCAGHTLQLVINHALKDTNISRAIGASRSIVDYFRRSELAHTKLVAKQKLMHSPEHNMIQDVSTRWNSTFYMIERLLEQRWPVTATLSDPEITAKGKKYLDLKAEQWVLLEELVEGLRPFECATVYLSGQEYATASCLPQVIKGLQRSMQQRSFETGSGKAFLSNAKHEVAERWGNLISVASAADVDSVKNPILIASALDPRFLKLKFLTPEDGTRVQGAVEVLAIKQAKESAGFGDSTKQYISAPPEKSVLDVLLSDTDSPNSEEDEETQDDQMIQMVRNEVQRYFAGPPLGKKEDPLKWWGGNEKSFPTLSKVAKSLLCIPATSTPAERIFSAAGNICSQKRACLTPEHVEMLTFLCLNKM